MRSTDLKKTDEWELYEVGKNYKRRIQLYQEVDKNERFYAGKQWEGVVSNGLPTPVFNVLKRVIDYKIAELVNNNLKAKYSADGINQDLEPELYNELSNVSNIFSKYAETTWERLKMDKTHHEGLLDGAISGDMITYWYWDNKYQTGQKISGENVYGELCCELIDNVNYFPGNPNSSDIQSQPYIILAYRKLVSEVMAEAKRNGVNEIELTKIGADEDNEYQSGDMKKYELEESGKNSGKCILLLKLWRDEKTGTIWFKKSTSNVVIKKDTDTGLFLYPVALMNWYKRKNSCHGVAEASGLIPNQIYINKIAAMLMMNTMYMSFPKLLYDKTRIAAPSNQIGAALGVQGDINGAAQFLYPPSASGDAFGMFDKSIQTTKEMMGASDAALGEVRPENTSAIIAIREASAVPLKNISQRYYQFVEDEVLIWLDFWTTYYKTDRILKIQKDGQEQQVLINPSKYKNYAWRIKVDVGPSSTFSEIASIQTLDNLLMQGKIDITQYLKRVPNGVVPMREELINEIQQVQAQAMQQQQSQMDNETKMANRDYELMAQFMESLPEDVQAQLKSLPDAQLEETLMGMMEQKPESANEPMGEPKEDNTLQELMAKVEEQAREIERIQKEMAYLEDLKGAGL